MEAMPTRLRDLELRELETWAAYLETGSYRMTALRLGVHEQTVKRHIGMLKDVYGVKTNAQLAVILERSRE
jgi:DNA-binding CsgD family transcriptional regulator